MLFGTGDPVENSGGESVSQLPLKDKAFLTFLGQNPPFELRPKTGVSPPIFSWNPSWPIQVLANPSISAGGGQQGWLAFEPRQVEQDLLIARALVNLFGDAFLRDELSLPAMCFPSRNPSSEPTVKTYGSRGD
jgi:hypothetical protein